MPSAAYVALGGVAAAYLFLRVLLDLTQDAKEPPAIETTIPFLGPIFGMVRKKTDYYIQLRDKFKLPVYTIRLPFTRVYVINATELVPAMQKEWHLLSFGAITARAAVTVGISKRGCDIISKDMEKDSGFAISWPLYIKPIMGPGPDLDLMNRMAVNVVAENVDGLSKMTRASKETIGIWEWTRRTLLVATTDATFGPLNPYRDQGVADAWRIFEAGYLNLSISPLPSMFHSQVMKARETIAAALIDYMKKDGWKTASPLVRGRYEHHHGQFGLSTEDCARGELGNTFAVLGNTLVAAWWLIWHIFSDEKILADIREEVEALVQMVPGGDGKEDVCAIDMARIRDACPILLSTFQETMRVRTVTISVRVILDDVLLDGKYLLKKGNTLMLPGPVQHTSEPAWGPTVHEFDHMRFVRRPGVKRPNPTAFRGFGGGHSLCPGRHFATTEILALVGLLVLRFDIKPARGGKWVEPTTKNSPIVAGFPVPDYDFDVDITARDDRQYKVSFTGSGLMDTMSDEVVVEE